MKNDVLEYKGYHTKIVFDSSTKSVRGKIEGIKDLVDFETCDLSKIEEEFHSAVDDYLEFCEEVGKEPDKEYSGTFNVRISPELHKEIALYASKEGISLNAAVENAIKEYVKPSDIHEVSIEQTIKMVVEKLKNHSTYNYHQYRTWNNNVIKFPLEEMPTGKEMTN